MDPNYFNIFIASRNVEFSLGATFRSILSGLYIVEGFTELKVSS